MLNPGRFEARSDGKDVLWNTELLSARNALLQRIWYDQRRLSTYSAWCCSVLFAFPLPSVVFFLFNGAFYQFFSQYLKGGGYL